MSKGSSNVSASYKASLTWNDLDITSFLLNNTIYVLAVDLVLYPSDLLTTRLQADKISDGRVHVRKVLKDIYRREGIKGLFRGFAVNTAGHFPGQFLYYSSYEYSNQKLRSLLMGNDDGTNPHRFTPLIGITCNATAGMIAECISAFSYLPTDIITQRLQVNSKINFHRKTISSSYGPATSALKVVRHVWKSEGIKGFYRGFGPYMLVYGPGSAVWWASYESSKAFLFKGFKQCGFKMSEAGSYAEGGWLKLLSYIISGGFAGAVGYTVTNPFEVAKTRLQLLEVGKSMDHAQLKRGYWSLIGEVYRNEGIPGLFKGLKPRLLIRTPVSAIAFVGYEYLKDMSIKQGQKG